MAAELIPAFQEPETAYEELQSAHEELETMSQELRQRTVDLNKANAVPQSILVSPRAGVAVVDRQLDVLVWNHRAEDLWGLGAGGEREGVVLLMEEVER